MPRACPATCSWIATSILVHGNTETEPDWATAVRRIWTPCFGTLVPLLPQLRRPWPNTCLDRLQRHVAAFRLQGAAIPFRLCPKRRPKRMHVHGLKFYLDPCVSHRDSCSCKTPAAHWTLCSLCDRPRRVKSQKLKSQPTNIQRLASKLVNIFYRDTSNSRVKPLPNDKPPNCQDKPSRPNPK